MKTSFAVTAVLLTGIGGFGGQSLQAQTKPPVYMIEDNTVRDAEGFAKEFAPLARESVKIYPPKNSRASLPSGSRRFVGRGC